MADRGPLIATIRTGFDRRVIVRRIERDSRLPVGLATARYARYSPEATLLYELVDQHYPAFLAALERDGRRLPTFVQQEFAAYLTCGRLEHGFLRVRCTQCHAERLVAFSCKRRGFCPSCGARRMVETAALLVDEVLPRQPAGRCCPLSTKVQSRKLPKRRLTVLSRNPTVDDGGCA